MRYQLEVRELPVAYLVQNRARLRVAVVVALLRLQGAEYLERTPGELGIDQEVLDRRNQAVAAERRNEPRQAGCRQEDHMIGAGDRQPQRCHILERLAI